MRKYMNVADIVADEGLAVGISDWIVIDQERIDLFARATQDFQWIHVDAARSAAGPYGSTIAHGYLTLSLIPALAATVFEFATQSPALNYGLNRVRFLSPVTVESRVRAHVSMVAAQTVAQGLQITMAYRIEIEGIERPACIAETIFLILQPEASE